MSKRIRTFSFLIVGVLLVATVGGCMSGSSSVERCGEGLVALGPRCCGEGQHLDEEQHCTGEPFRCTRGQHRTPIGCVPEERRVFLAGGRVFLGPSDWEAQGVIAARTLEVAPFWMDRTEVTENRLARCAAAGACAQGPSPMEPGRAALLSPEQAETLCRWAGGRLPTEDEWIFAATGTTARRYPWGDTGAVCRRAAFGLEMGPCARDARGPDTAGAHPDGDSPEGLTDLAGNVAEWVRRQDGTYGLRGGSYRSALATQLRSWSSGAVSPQKEGGARCVYDQPG